MMPESPVRSDAVSGIDSAGVTQSFSVRFDYPICFTAGCLTPANPTLVSAMSRLEPGRRHRFVAVIDAGVAALRPGLADEIARYAEYYADHVVLVAAPRILIGGEEIKNDPDAATHMQAWLHEWHIDRQSCVLAIGGGALLDMVGYAAATTHRGVRIVRVPTTVLAQADSGVGVKNGMNAFGTKNFLGAFAPPFAVINDFDFIRILPRRDRIAGIAEAVKVAAIRDPDFYDWLAAHARDLAECRAGPTSAMIYRSATLHARHIALAGDPFEFGSARPLDFGHWAAHKLETLTRHTLRHGEAVAIGIALDTRYSVASGLLAEEAADALLQLMETLGFRLWDDTLDLRNTQGRRRVLGGLSEFREHLGGALTITLLTSPGHAVEVHEIDEAMMDGCIEWLKQRDERRCA